MLSLSWPHVLSWRCRRQLLHRPTPDPLAVVRALAGVQAQVTSAAEQAVAVRQPVPDPASVRAAVAAKRLVKTWSARGTLHLLDVAEAPAHLALLAAARTWEKPSWQKTFVTAGQLEQISAAAWEALDGTVLSRDELTTAIVEHAGDPGLEEHLRSGWGTVLKPLAWQGLLVYGPPDGGSVTFTRPDTFLPGWAGLPSAEDAARVVIPAYLGAFGPASPATFDQWLIRGLSKKAMLKGWFKALLADGVVTEVEVEGERLYARTADLDSLAAADPADFGEVRLLPAFDQFVLGPGTADTRVVPPGRRPEISRTAGWISPVVAHRGRVAGTWDRTDGKVTVNLFPEHGEVPAASLREEITRVTTS
ncbi:winged helix DNA-binding domain-containing protein [Dactylosporangium fulvum]|uniref:Winged helix DNA-binding domain-containing protein n=1 Tax=Dactylosporangium fulvum TaxID=53359 RepID=A0ABY5VN44_9ACTN|nr:winged helix DNA-binding domain-containing protein [Dactylosporangium fulvum]UWP78545.1 winged helix DNA-binding domain-containing protein [Dactylosporangium fulvum]